MTCPVCWFPGNAPAAERCVQCGWVLPVADQQYAQPVPMSPPISVNPISGPPPVGYQTGYYAPVPVPARSRGPRVVLPLTVIVVVLVIASTVLAVVRLTGGDTGTVAGNAVAGVTALESPSAGSAGSAGSTGSAAPAVTSAAPAATPAPAADPRAQAAAIDAVLDASIASRKKLNDAIKLVGDCTLIEKAIGDLRTVGTERESQMASVSRFDLSALPRGEELRSLLNEALSYSLAADRSFVLWAQAVQGSGCGGSGSGHYDEAQAQSRNASAAKERFVAVWNPVVAPYGLRYRSSNDI
ncbi:hypothetical protein KZZ52_53480 [Dactylosporangium sp. AC04546]|uniref:hypothetical protein n=1 Tax=Dactylosporangium sp. AC04546 TaxID=2862460 RepID=UPI001EDE9AF0|nr:hypothetical protein [Dactylosporangium sp. AC04546]WVK82668.1 hypothetical protein KZZ52_53480 [Dactylosporangium sp. AC04546]